MNPEHTYAIRRGLRQLQTSDARQNPKEAEGPCTTADVAEAHRQLRSTRRTGTCSESRAKQSTSILWVPSEWRPRRGSWERSGVSRSTVPEAKRTPRSRRSRVSPRTPCLLRCLSRRWSHSFLTKNRRLVSSCSTARTSSVSLSAVQHGLTSGHALQLNKTESTWPSLSRSGRTEEPRSSWRPHGRTTAALGQHWRPEERLRMMDPW